MRYTLRDLVATVTVIALFLSLTVSMLLSRREKARRTQCQDNLRHLALACLNYESTFAAYPAAVLNFSNQSHWISTGKENGMTSAGPNWGIQITDSMGELQPSRHLHPLLLSNSQFRFNVANDIKPLPTPEFMICPAAPRATLLHSSPRTKLLELAKGNYAACLGSGMYLEGIDGSSEVDEILKQRAESDNTIRPGRERRGVMTVVVSPLPDPRISDSITWPVGRGKGTKHRKIVDGVSKTVILSELLTVDGKGTIAGASDDLRGAWITPSMGGSTYSHKTTPNSTVKDQINGCETDVEDLPSGSRLNCVEQIATGPTAGDTFAAARSQHRGGVMAAKADGSVKFYSNDIDSAVWAALGTRAGGE